jgi:hypothetical protein
VKTFLIDLQGGGLDRFGPAAPLLYPLDEADGLRILTPSGAELGTAALTMLADAARIELRRERAHHWLAIILVDLNAATGTGSDCALTNEIDRIRTHFLRPLSSDGLTPTRTFIVAVDSLARQPHTGAPIEPLARKRWEADTKILSEPNTSALADVTVFRFPQRRSPDPALQEDRLRLAYLLLSLNELARQGKDLPRERLYEVERINLDKNEVSDWIFEYARCLQQAEQMVGGRLNHREPVELQLIGDRECGCGQPLPSVSLTHAAFGRLHRKDDFHTWRNWATQTGSTLHRRSVDGETMVRRCISDRGARQFTLVTQTIASLDDEAARMSERARAARKRLIQDASHREESWDWEDEIRSRTPRLRAILEARPRQQAFIIFTAAMSLTVLVTALATVPGTGVARFLIPTALLLGGCALATALSIRSLKVPLEEHVHSTLERAQKIAHLIGERVDRELRHLEALCEVDVARRNEETVARAQQDQGQDVLLLKLHRRELQRHLSLVGTLQRLFPALAAGASSDRPAAPPDGTWPLGLPPHRHPGYSPLLCAASAVTQQHELLVGTRSIAWESKHLRGFLSLCLRADRYYGPMAHGATAENPPSPLPTPDPPTDDVEHRNMDAPA